MPPCLHLNTRMQQQPRRMRSPPRACMQRAARRQTSTCFCPRPQHLAVCHDEPPPPPHTHTQAPHWNYLYAGRDWTALEDYPGCRGLQQSPINVPSKTALARVPAAERSMFEFGTVAGAWANNSLTNNGHTVQLSLPAELSPPNASVSHSIDGSAEGHGKGQALRGREAAGRGRPSRCLLLKHTKLAATLHLAHLKHTRRDNHPPPLKTHTHTPRW